MVNTKQTPRKTKEVCPMCFIELENKDAWTDHVLKCASNAIQCSTCHVSFKKKAYLRKHMRTKHPELSTTGVVETAPAQEPAETPQAEESDWDKDPGELLGDVSASDESESESEDEVRCILESTPSTSTATDEDLLSGRMFRKRTQPAPVFTRKVIKRSIEVPEGTQAQKEKKFVDGATQVETFAEMNDACVQTAAVETRDVGTQSEKYRKRTKTVTVVKYQEGGKSVETITECEEFFNM